MLFFSRLFCTHTHTHIRSFTSQWALMCGHFISCVFFYDTMISYFTVHFDCHTCAEQKNENARECGWEKQKSHLSWCSVWDAYAYIYICVCSLELQCVVEFYVQLRYSIHIYVYKFIEAVCVCFVTVLIMFWSFGELKPVSITCGVWICLEEWSHVFGAISFCYWVGDSSTAQWVENMTEKCHQFRRYVCCLFLSFIQIFNDFTQVAGSFFGQAI